MEDLYKFMFVMALDIGKWQNKYDGKEAEISVVLPYTSSIYHKTTKIHDDSSNYRSKHAHE